MAGAAFFVRLTDGTDATAVTLTDKTKYFFNTLRGCEFVPQVALERDSWLPDIEDVIIVEVVGSTPYQVRKNLRAVTKLLQQANRWALDRHSSLSPVRVEYTPPGSSPGRVYAGVITGWNTEEYTPEDYNHQINLNLSVLLTIRITHRPWLHVRWTNEQLLAGTIGMTGWTGTATALTSHAFTGAYGGTTYLRSTLAGGTQYAYRTQGVTSGVTYTVSGTYATSIGVSAINVVFRNSARTLNRSNVAAIALLVETDIAAGTRWTCQLVANATDASAVLEISFVGDPGDQLEFAEVLSVAGADVSDDWHQTYIEETESAASSSTNADVINVVTFANEPAYLSPAEFYLNSFSQATYPTIGGGLLITTPNGDDENITIHDFPTASTKTTGAFATTNDSANKPLGGTNVTTYTPADTTKVSFHTAPQAIAGTFAYSSDCLLAFAKVRNNSASATYYLSLKYSRNGGSSHELTPVAVGPYSGSAAPQIVPLGEMWSEDGWQNWELLAQASATGAGGLAVDSVVFVRAVPGTMILKLPATTLSTAGTYTLVVDPRLSTNWRPRIAYEVIAAIPATYAPISYQGDPYPQNSGTSMLFLWYATLGAFWRHSTSGGTLTAVTAAAVRSPQFPLPE